MSDGAITLTAIVSERSTGEKLNARSAPRFWSFASEYAILSTDLIAHDGGIIDDVVQTSTVQQFEHFVAPSLDAALVCHVQLDDVECSWGRCKGREGSCCRWTAAACVDSVGR